MPLSHAFVEVCRNDRDAAVLALWISCSHSAETEREVVVHGVILFLGVFPAVAMRLFMAQHHIVAHAVAVKNIVIGDPDEAGFRAYAHGAADAAYAPAFLFDAGFIAAREHDMA